MSERLEDIAAAMVATGKGLLAADESTATIGKRFDTIGLTSTRNVAPRLSRDAVSRRRGDEGLYFRRHPLSRRPCSRRPPTARRSSTSSAQPAPIPGIKVDTGAKPMAKFPGETITEGLDGLGERLKTYYDAGARFAKWRGVIAGLRRAADASAPIKANAQALARYAALCQEAGIVPIVEPEVLMDGAPGDSSIERCAGGHRRDAAHRLRGTERRPRQPRRHDPEAEHGHRRQEGAQGLGRRSRRAHRPGSEAHRAVSRSRHRLPLRRPVQRGGNGASLRHEGRITTCPGR